MVPGPPLTLLRSPPRPQSALTLETEVLYHRGNIWGNAELEKILVCIRIRQVATIGYPNLVG